MTIEQTKEQIKEQTNRSGAISEGVASPLKLTLLGITIDYLSGRITYETYRAFEKELSKSRDKI